MKTYTTKSGDTFDWIAWREMGSTKYLELLINANRALVDTYIFSAGTVLNIPEVPQTSTTKLPPWRLQ